MEAIKLGTVHVCIYCVLVYSALEIERVILEHPLVSECAVIGVQDEDLGQKVVAIVIPTTDNHKLVSSPCYCDGVCDILLLFCR